MLFKSRLLWIISSNSQRHLSVHAESCVWAANEQMGHTTLSTLLLVNTARYHISSVWYYQWRELLPKKRKRVKMWKRIQVSATLTGPTVALRRGVKLIGRLHQADSCNPFLVISAFFCSAPYPLVSLVILDAGHIARYRKTERISRNRLGTTTNATAVSSEHQNHAFSRYQIKRSHLYGERDNYGIILQ